jgi:membrane protease YdiL (CAAX protease family)
LEKPVFPALSSRRKAAIFYVLAVSLSTVLALVTPSAEGAAVFGMFAPLLAMLMMKLVVTRDGWRRTGWAGLGLHRLGLRHWPIAMLLPAAVLAASFGFAAALGLLSIDLGAMAPADMVIGLAFAVLLGLGEESGWRGYLLPLVRVRNPRSGAVIVGLLHGLWHLPLFLLTGYFIDGAGSRLVTIPIFLVTLTAAGVVYAWLRDRSGSVWPVVLMHQTFNSLAEAIMRGATVAAPVTLAYTSGETGVVTMLLVVALAIAIEASGRWSRTPSRAAVREPLAMG